MNIAIVDDTKEEAEQLFTYISSYIGDTAKIDMFPGGEDFLSVWDGLNFDLIVLDIFMDDMLGIDVAKKIRETNDEVCIIFCTSSNDFANESYDVAAKYYLHKPITAERIKNMMDRINLQQINRSRTVTLPDGQRVLLRNLLYAEYIDRKVTIRNKVGDDTVSNITQAQAEEIFCAFDSFICCSKGVIVNFNEVTAIKKDTFLMSDGKALPISRRKDKEVRDAYADFRFQKIRNGGD